MAFPWVDYTRAAIACLFLLCSIYLLHLYLLRIAKEYSHHTLELILSLAVGIAFLATDCVDSMLLESVSDTALSFLNRFFFSLLLILNTHILGQVFKQLVGLWPFWTEYRIKILQICIGGLSIAYGIANLLPWMMKGNKNEKIWNDAIFLIEGVAGTILFEIYYIWQNMAVRTGIDQILQRSLLSAMRNNGNIKPIRRNSEFFIPKLLVDIACGTALILLLLQIGSIIMIFIPESSQDLKSVSYSLLKLSGVLNAGQMVLSLYLLDTLLLGLNIKSKIQSTGAKEKALEFIEKWRKKTGHDFQTPSPSLVVVDISSDLSIFNDDSSRSTSPIPSTQPLTHSKQMALELFKKSYTKMPEIDKLKAQLKEKQQEAKSKGNEAREMKTTIQSLKETHGSDPELINTLTSAYKQACLLIKSLMDEIQSLQKVLEKERGDLNAAFEIYYAKVLEAESKLSSIATQSNGPNHRGIDSSSSSEAVGTSNFTQSFSGGQSITDKEHRTENKYEKRAAFDQFRKTHILGPEIDSLKVELKEKHAIIKQKELEVRKLRETIKSFVTEISVAANIPDSDPAQNTLGVPLGIVAEESKAKSSGSDLAAAANVEVLKVMYSTAVADLNSKVQELKNIKAAIEEKWAVALRDFEAVYQSGSLPLQ